MVKKGKSSASAKQVLYKSKSLKGSLEVSQIAHYTFFAGIIVAVIASFFRNVVAPELLITTLVFLGFVVGL
ncbi:MAG: hypothetical protein Q8R37_01200, partial [Nanoarchaeota archaeon]|nr:hypothetical protein [Nanoarchaeota archaeon]